MKESRSALSNLSEHRTRRGPSESADHDSLSLDWGHFCTSNKPPGEDAEGAGLWTALEELCSKEWLRDGAVVAARAKDP